jgi:hypothetical protein
VKLVNDWFDFSNRSRAGTGTSFGTVASFSSYRSRLSNTASFHTCVQEDFIWLFFFAVFFFFSSDVPMLRNFPLLHRLCY